MWNNYEDYDSNHVEQKASEVKVKHTTYNPSTSSHDDAGASTKSEQTFITPFIYRTL